MTIRTPLCFAAALVAAAALTPASVHAQAYCALRDPAPQIFELFPAATSYRSRVSTVDDSVRDAVRAALPFTLHARELGQHTLYSALKGNEELGIVHVRSESSDWGIVEITWSIVGDNIQDFRFQRCRGAACRADAVEDLHSLLRGKSVESVRSLLTPDGEALADDVLASADAPTRRLATIVVRSAAKTLAVTGIVWSHEI
jgi:hypothetical protein